MLLSDDENLKKIEYGIESYSEKHNISAEQILVLIKMKRIPVNIFNKKLSPLETIVKYLMEEQKKTLTEISKLLNKKVSIIWLAYNHSKKKHPQKLQDVKGEYDIPLEKLYSKKLSLLQRICVYLKDHYRLNYHEIGVLLQRDERTIWTTYQRAKNN